VTPAKPGLTLAPRWQGSLLTVGTIALGAAIAGLPTSARAAAGSAAASGQIVTPAGEGAGEVLPIWPGQPPGTADWSGPETETSIRIPGEAPLRIVSNVTVPTLTVFRAAGPTTRTGVIVLPGGGFQNLAVDHEGYAVARWFAARGVTAFVLKYRVRPTPGYRMPNDLKSHPERFAEFARSFEDGRPIAVADGIQAMRFLRTNAGRFDIDSGRIGMIGFSAGAITTIGVVLNGSATERPNFAAPIYGALVEARSPSQDAPPLFLAATLDDNAVPVGESIKIFERWRGAGLPAELHVYEKGGHGFGMRKVRAPVDRWTEALQTWLSSHGWMAARPSKS